MANQYSDDKRGLGEYCPRVVVRLSEQQSAQLQADAAAANLPVARYLRCKAGLEGWPAEKQAKSTAKTPNNASWKNRAKTSK